MTNEFKIISEDALKTLCKAIKKVSTVGEILDDTNSVTDKTYSSFEIDRRLNAKIDKTQLTAVLDETVTDEQIASAKVVVDELGLKANDSEVVKKTDISTSINSTSTDDEVPGAKAVYNITSKFLKTYTSIEQLGLSNGSETIENIATTMESRTRLIAIIEGGNLSVYPNTSGTLIVEKMNIYRVHFKFCMDGSPKVFVGTYHAVSGFTGWKRLCTTTVADVPKTNLAVNSWASGNIYYTVKNGICYVTVNALKSATMSTQNQTIVSGLPKPMNDNEWYNIAANHRDYGSLLVNISGENLTNYIGSDNVPYYGTFSYPVAE